jgi:hypothetical protein
LSQALVYKPGAVAATTLHWVRSPFAYVQSTGVALAVETFFGLAYLTLWSVWYSPGPARAWDMVTMKNPDGDVADERSSQLQQLVLVGFRRHLELLIAAAASMSYRPIRRTRCGSPAAGIQALDGSEASEP